MEPRRPVIFSKWASSERQPGTTDEKLTYGSECQPAAIPAGTIKMTARHNPATYLHRSYSLGHSDAWPWRRRGRSPQPLTNYQLKYWQGANCGLPITYTPSWLPAGLSAERLRTHDVLSEYGNLSGSFASLRTHAHSCSREGCVSARPRPQINWLTGLSSETNYTFYNLLVWT